MLIVVIALIVSGCSRGPVTSDALPTIAQDSAIFESVVRSARDSAHALLFVDALPLRSTPDILEVSEWARALGRADAIRARHSVLKSMRVDTVDILRQGHCGGSLAQHTETSHVDCPLTKRVFVAVATARLGGAYDPSRSTQLPPKPDGREQWAVRVVWYDADNSGIGVTAYEYVLERERGRWNVVQRIAVFSAD